MHLKNTVDEINIISNSDSRCELLDNVEIIRCN